MDDITVSYSPDLSEEDRQIVLGGLRAYNAEHGYPSHRKLLDVIARTQEGQVVGGVFGEEVWGWLFISAVWVEREKRGAGIGTSLMEEAERQARDRGCVGIFLDTHSFQARPFYEGLGYRLFGEIPDFPPGGARFYLSKRLAPTASEAAAAVS